MTYRLIVLLILVGLLEPAWACRIIERKIHREAKEETVNGRGGDCYYKRIPQTEQTTNWQEQESWRTEFYISASSTQPHFVKEYYFDLEIVCLTDADGESHISYVVQGSRGGAIEFFLDGNKISSYSTLEVIGRGGNSYVRPNSCYHIYYSFYGDILYIKLNAEKSTYVYQVKLIDNHTLNYDLLTGLLLPKQQSLNVQLMDAIRNNNKADVEKLLLEGADPNLGNLADGTPLHLAADTGNITVAQLLIQAGAKVSRAEIPTQNLSTPLDYIPHHPVYMAAANGDLDMLEFLMPLSPDLNKPIFHIRFTPLEIAIMNEHIDAVYYLLVNGAEVTPRAIEIAAFKGQSELTEYLSNQLSR